MTEDTAVDPHVFTFLIADVRGYTRFTSTHGDEAGAALATAFASIVRDGITDFGGRLVEVRGDEALAVFGSARGALRAAAELHSVFAAHSAEHPDQPLAVGIGVDAGEAVPVEGGYRGGALNVAARLCALAEPGETLTSAVVTHIARRVEGLTYQDRGEHELKGIDTPIRVMAVAPARAETTPQVASEGSGRGLPALRPMTGELLDPTRLPFADFTQTLNVHLTEQLEAALAEHRAAARGWGHTPPPPAGAHPAPPRQVSPGVAVTQTIVRAMVAVVIVIALVVVILHF